MSATPTLSRLKRETICAALPEGVEPTTLWPSWPLEEVGAALELEAGEVLVDLACGRGEVGLWIARHLDVAWVGVDPSPVGLGVAAEAAAAAAAAEPVEAAASGRDGPAPRGGDQRSTRVVEGHFLATGLDDGTADAVLILDALHFCPDVPAALAEVQRILRPGRRLVIVGPQMTDPRPALERAGFAIERDEQTPDWRTVLGRFLELARAEADTLRAELGELTAGQLLSRDVGQLTDVGHGLIAARAPTP